MNLTELMWTEMRVAMEPLERRLVDTYERLERIEASLRRINQALDMIMPVLVLLVKVQRALGRFGRKEPLDSAQKERWG